MRGTTRCNAMMLDADTVSAIQLAVRLSNSAKDPQCHGWPERLRALCAETHCDGGFIAGDLGGGPAIVLGSGGANDKAHQ